MFEHMDVRVRAGPVMASSAGDRASFTRAARDWGVLLFGYFLLDKQEKVTRCPAGARKLLLLILLLILTLPLTLEQRTNHPAMADQDPPSNSNRSSTMSAGQA
jgi:hypothetical protein